MILDEIASKRRIQLNREMAKTPFDVIKRMASDSPPPRDFKSALKKAGSLSVIAEVKKASPSKGIISEDFRPVETAMAYEAAGADAISVLTEEYYFKGSAEFLKNIRGAVSVPVLRKDFIVDEYQIYEARAIGADAILLIAGLLDLNIMKMFYRIAKTLGLYCLAEAHNADELARVVDCGCDIIGINNRNLKTFHVDLHTTEKLIKQVPEGCVVVSESGIKNNADMQAVKSAGADAVLIGETLMRSGNIKSELHNLREGICSENKALRN